MDGIYDCISMKVFSFFLLVQQKKDYLDYSVLQLKLLAIPSGPVFRDFRDTYCGMQDSPAFLFSSSEEFVSLCIIIFVVLDFFKGIYIHSVYVGFKQDCYVSAVVLFRRKS